MFGAKRSTTLCALAAAMLIAAATALSPSVMARMLLATDGYYDTPPSAFVALSTTLDNVSTEAVEQPSAIVPSPVAEAPSPAPETPVATPDRDPSSRGARQPVAEAPATQVVSAAPALEPAPAGADAGLAATPQAQLLEARLLELLNKERAQHGLGTLVPDGRLVELARQRSIDMASRSYFGHVTPEGKMVFEAIDAAGIKYRLAGENLARNTYPADESAEVAHEGFMNSPTHRQNELEPEFDRVGIGVAIAPNATIYFTELFIAAK